MDAAAMISTYLRLAWRRKWWLVVPLVLGLCGSYVAFQRLPKLYLATTLILVRPQNIPSEYVKPTVTDSIEGGLKTIQQQVESRTRLEQVARALEIIPDDLPPVDVENRIEGMRARISVQVREQRSFTLSYIDRDPARAAAVANLLADRFIEDNALGRQEQARATSEFLADELERMRDELVKQESAIADFKRRYQAELPSQENANLSMVEQLQRDLRANELSQERARDRKALLEAQLSGQSPRRLSGEPDRHPADPLARLASLRTQLADLKSRYTERYPEVQRLERQIEELEKAIAAGPQDDPGEVLVPDPATDNLRTEIQGIRLELAYLEAEEARLREDLAVYRSRIENAPQREQELLSLTRDYDTLKANYQGLLSKQTEAELAETLEEERKGEQFVILDRAKPPVRPYRPEPIQVFGIGLLLGLGLGVGVVALLEVLHPTFVSPGQVQEALGIPVIAAVPRMKARSSRWRKVGAWMLPLLAGLGGSLDVWMR